jgi:hypothetical protein
MSQTRPGFFTSAVDLELNLDMGSVKVNLFELLVIFPTFLRFRLINYAINLVKSAKPIVKRIYRSRWYLNSYQQ